MYNLENGVQWTQRLKNAFKHNITRAKVLFEETEINEQNKLNSLTLDEERYISNLGFVGTATARKLELNLIDIDKDLNLENKELILKIGADFQGYNLVNFSSGWTPSANTNYRFANNSCAVESTAYSTNNYAEQDITELIRTNPGKRIWFNCEISSSSFSNASTNNFVKLIITNDGTTTTRNLLYRGSGSAITISYYDIPSDTTDITEVKIRITANEGASSSNRFVAITNPMIRFSTSPNTYEPYYSDPTLYINYGNFIVDKPPEIDETNGRVKVIAYDYMIKFNKNYQNTITYPCTLRALLENICLQAGVELGSASFLNENFSVVDNQFEGATLREVLQNIAKCAFSWARIGQDNKLYLDFAQNAANTEAITIDEYKTNSFKKANEYYGPINQVTYADSYIEGQEAKVPAETPSGTIKELVIYDNLFAYTPEKRQELIQAGESLLGLTYMPVMQLDTIGFAYLDCRDIINVQTLNNETFTTRVFNHSITYNGALEDSIVTEGTSANEEAYKNTAATIFQNQQTRIIVDKANQTIKSVVENVDVQDAKISVIQQTVDELNSKISEIADTTISQETYSGRLTFEDINESQPIRVEIKPTGENITYLYPRTNLYPATDLYIPFRRLRFTNTSTSEVFEYELPDDLLYYNDSNYDNFVLDYANGTDATVQITKKCGYDANGNVVVLSQSRIDTYPFPNMPLTDGDYTVEILKYEGVPYTAYFFCRLMAQNIYTTQFVTGARLNSEISQTVSAITTMVEATYETQSNANSNYSSIDQRATNIETTVGQKVGKTEVISSINQSPEAITIDANKISLNGKNIDLTSQNISINSDNFKVTTDGTITAKAGKIAEYTISGAKLVGTNVGLSGKSGDGYAFWAGSNTPSSAPFRVGHDGTMVATNGTFTGDLYMAANKKLASTSQGIMSTLFAQGTGPIEGYEYLGYASGGQTLIRTAPMVGIYIPSNFTPVYAYLFIEQIQPHFVVDAGSVDGRASAIKVRKGSSGPSMTLYGFASELTINQSAFSGTDITQATFGSSTKVPNVGMTVSNNIASQLNKGQLNVLSAYITDGSYDNTPITIHGTEVINAGRITGLAKLSIQVIGYLNPF